jgi:uncharacterized membrane protein YeiB
MLQNKPLYAGYEVARALALFGMMFMNFRELTGVSAKDPFALLTNTLAGRAEATYMLLIGIGITLFTADERFTADLTPLRKKRNALFRGSLLLLVIGVCCFLVFPNNVISAIAIGSMASLLFLTTSKRFIFIAAIATLIVFVLITLLGTNFETGWTTSPEGQLLYADFWSPQGMFRYFFYNGHFALLPWASVVLLGTWMGRFDVSKREYRYRMISIGLVVMIVAENLSKILIQSFDNNHITIPGYNISTILGTGDFPPTAAFMLSAGGSAVAIIMIFVGLERTYPNARWIQWLQKTGQMSLSLYIVHVLTIVPLVQWLSWNNTQSMWFCTIATVLCAAAAIGIAQLWYKVFLYGPVEWLMVLFGQGKLPWQEWPFKLERAKTKAQDTKL